MSDDEREFKLHLKEIDKEKKILFDKIKSIELYQENSDSQSDSESDSSDDELELYDYSLQNENETNSNYFSHEIDEFLYDLSF